VGDSNRACNGVNNGANSMSHGVGDGDGLRVGGGALVGHLGDITLGVVGGVGDVLDAAIGEVDGVAALPGGGAVVRLGHLEVGAGVVVGHGVVVGEGGDLVGVDLSHGVGHGGVVGRGGMDDRGSVNKGGGMDNRGVVGRGSMNNRGSVNNGGSMNNRGGVVDRGGNSMSDGVGNSVAETMSNDSSLSKVGRDASHGGVAHGVAGGHRGDGGAEGLGLAGGPHLTLEGLGDGLVGALPSRNNMTDMADDSVAEELRCR